jgi:type I restriction enzyme S subunit
VVRAFDIVISTCRPTRGAIGVVPLPLHDQIASTAFSIVRAKNGINPIYLHYALRLPSTLEQFRKWSTGSSYPAILDEDVKKTLIPVPAETAIQDQIAKKIVATFLEREKTIALANNIWNEAINNISQSLCNKAELTETEMEGVEAICTTAHIRSKIAELPPLTVDAGANSALKTHIF